MSVARLQGLVVKLYLKYVKVSHHSLRNSKSTWFSGDGGLTDSGVVRNEVTRITNLWWLCGEGGDGVDI